MSLCRLCLTESEAVHKLYGDNGGEIGPIISQWFQIVPNDVVSTVICVSCLEKTLNFHQFCCTVYKAQNDFFKDSNFVKLLPYFDHCTPLIASRMEIIDCAEFNGTLMEFQNKTETLDPIECKVELVVENADKMPYLSDSQLDGNSKNPLTTIKTDEPNESSGGESNSSSNKPDPKQNRRSKNVKQSSEPIFETSSSNRMQSNKEKKELEDDQIRQFCNMFCDVCITPTQFESFADAIKHYRDCHAMMGYLVCCNLKIRKRIRLIDHLNKHLNPDVFRCKTCNRMLKDGATLKKHMKTHNSEDQKSFQCDQCPKKYASNYLLKYHKFLSHHKEEDKVYKCDKCQKKFLSKPILTAHIKRAHIAPPEVCNYCGKEFKCKYYLKVHRNEAHMGIEIKRVQCNLCGVWMRENHLSKHVKFNHTQAEPSLICSICSKEVKNRVTMKSHMRNVHGNREHLCTVCGKTFSVSIGLKEHMAVHTGEDLYKCRYCTKTFKANANMHKHQKNAHFNEWEENRRKRLIDGRLQ